VAGRGTSSTLPACAPADTDRTRSIAARCCRKSKGEEVEAGQKAHKGNDR
jgi:hypothetical protein